MSKIEEAKNKVGKIEEPIEATISEVDLKIEEWFISHFHGVSEMTTAVYNKAFEAKEHLKQILKGE